MGDSGREGEPDYRGRRVGVEGGRVQQPLGFRVLQRCGLLPSVSCHKTQLVGTMACLLQRTREQDVLVEENGSVVCGFLSEVK